MPEVSAARLDAELQTASQQGAGRFGCDGGKDVPDTVFQFTDMSFNSMSNSDFTFVRYASEMLMTWIFQCATIPHFIDF